MALFLLYKRGETLLWVGRDREIPDPLREELAAVSHARIGDMLLLEDGRLQVASAPVKRGQRRLASLHAVLDPRALDGQLASDELAAEGEVYLVGGEGRYLTGTRTRGVGAEYGFDLPALASSPR